MRRIRKGGEEETHAQVLEKGEGMVERVKEKGCDGRKGLEKEEGNTLASK